MLEQNLSLRLLFVNEREFFEWSYDRIFKSFSIETFKGENLKENLTKHFKHTKKTLNFSISKFNDFQWDVTEDAESCCMKTKKFKTSWVSKSCR